MSFPNTCKKRIQASQRAKEAENAHKEGKVKKGGFKELWADLNG